MTRAGIVEIGGTLAAAGLSFWAGWVFGFPLGIVFAIAIGTGMFVTTTWIKSL